MTTTDSYDALDRLTDITAPTGTIHYGYDAVGNRTSMTDATGPTSYTYDVADELTAATAPGGTTSYGYDANGNETAAGQWTYAVNLANQLAAATNGTDSVNYAYDGDGNWTTSTSGGETTSLLWDANFALPQLALEADSGGGLIRRYSYGVGRISMTTPQATAYYSTDALGSVTEMSGDKGAILGSYDTNPFGDGTSSSNVDPSAAGNPIGFVGEYRDPVTGLVNLRARNYDRTTGRFLSPDPLGPQDYASSYVYVADNPLGYTDPSGMKRGTCTSLKCWISSGGWEHLGPSGGLCGSWIGVAGPLVGASATGSSCLVWAHGPHGWSFGMTVTGGGGGGTGAGFFGSLGFMGSTATNVNQYGGTFVEGSVSGGAPVSGVATGFSGGIGNDVTGGYVGIGAGGVAAGSAAFTRTTVLCFYGCQR